MLAVTAVATVFLASMLVFGLMWMSMESQELDRRSALSRRLGPGAEEDMAVAELQRRQEEPLPWLGPMGVGLHAVAQRTGGRFSALTILGLTVLFMALGVGGMIWLFDGPVVAVGLIAGVFPYLYIHKQIESRSLRITEQLPDALDLMGRALRAGHPFTDALRMAAMEMPAPLGPEFMQTAEHHRLGIELRECLEGLARRIPGNFEVRYLVSAVMLQRETGGNLIEVLENLSDTIRDRIVFGNKVSALTAEVRATGSVLQVLPFFVLGALLITEPNYLNPLFEPGLGRNMLVYAGSSMAMGAWIMRRIADVEF